MANKLCQKCGKMRDEAKYFYLTRQGERYDLCKDCLTMHINAFDEETFLWVLKALDFPYNKTEWDKIVTKEYNKNPNFKGGIIIGKYLAKMRLGQYKDKGFDDSAAMAAAESEKRKQNEAEHNAYMAELKAKYENGEIPEAQYKTMMDIAELNKDYEKNILQQEGPALPQNQYTFLDDSAIDNSSDLTDDDKLYLAMKWGTKYKPMEWVLLEKSYSEMMESFDIQDADTINTLILICKTNLKMNQCLDEGDIEGYQKLAKVSESLRKSAKFTAAQNKEKQNDFINSIGELVAYCEKNGGVIPPYKIDTPKDIVDKVIKDMKDYTKELIYEDKALAKQIEDYLKKVENAKQQEKDAAEAEKLGLDKLELTDQDYVDYQEAIEKDIEHDEGEF